MLVVLMWAAAVLVGLVVLVAAGLGLRGHAQRLLRTAFTARDDLRPRVRDLVGRLPRRTPDT